MDERSALRPRIGVLALQGAFDAHRVALESFDVVVTKVRRPADLIGLDGIVLPGGESTTMSNLLVSSGLLAPLRRMIDDGLPVLGTCAGLILLADGIIDGRPDQVSFGALAVDVRRNGYGRQIDSFEVDLAIEGFATPFHAVFIRAPKVERCDPNVSVLARLDGTPVLVRSRSILGMSFHPELTGDGRIHRLFVDQIVADRVSKSESRR